ncbi:MAG TPA: substrate-binding domain-containing protein, partial [Agromyces sp.]
LSVIGFDDIPEAAYFAPALTTIRQDFELLGRDVMATVLDALDALDMLDVRRDGRAGSTRDARLAEASVAPGRPARLPELIVRSSTAPPRAGAAWA